MGDAIGAVWEGVCQIVGLNGRRRLVSHCVFFFLLCVCVCVYVVLNLNPDERDQIKGDVSVVRSQCRTEICPGSSGVSVASETRSTSNNSRLQISNAEYETSVE